MKPEIARCCGTCIHCSKPKKAEDHEAHYMIAKTERWCYLNNLNTTRECVCENYEMNAKGAGVRACKRAFSFNDRAERIKKLVDKMKEFNIEELNTYGWNPKSFVVKDDWLYRKYIMTHPYTKEKYISLDKINPKEKDFDNIEYELYNDLNKKESQKDKL